MRRGAGRWELDIVNGIFEGDAFRIVFGEPAFGGILGGEDLQVVDVANVFARFDVDPDRYGSSLIRRNISFTSVSQSLPA